MKLFYFFNLICFIENSILYLHKHRCFIYCKRKKKTFNGLGWVVRFWTIVRIWDLGLWGEYPSSEGHRLSKWSYLIFTRVSEKIMKNFERLGWQARPRNEPATSCLPVFERSHWWGQGRTVWYPCLTRDSNPGPLVQHPTSLTIATLGRQWLSVSDIKKPFLFLIQKVYIIFGYVISITQTFMLAREKEGK